MSLQLIPWEALHLSIACQQQTETEQTIGITAAQTSGGIRRAASSSAGYPTIHSERPSNGQKQQQSHRSNSGRVTHWPSRAVLFQRGHQAKMVGYKRKDLGATRGYKAATRVWRSSGEVGELAKLVVA